jgi:UDP-N-acetylmuramoylalanine--D-glutamate ligase
VTRYAGKLGFVLPSGCETASEGQPAVPGLEETVFSDYPQRENFILLRALWLRLGLPEKTLIEAAHSFSLGRHRLALVRELGGVGYWNDSKATNFHAVEAALGRFASPVILIAGGKAKGGDIPAFVRRIASRVKFMLLIGATKEILAAACCEQGVEHELCTTLDEAVAKAAAMAVPGDQVLLSPAFASFDMFRGYDHRGEIFEQLVNHLTPAVADKTRAL